MNAPIQSPSPLTHLLTPAALAAQARAGALLIEVGCGTHDQYQAAHIPGALYLDTASLETPPLFNKVADPDLLDVLLGLGIRHDSTVLLYGRSTIAAARAAHLMLYAGVADVRLLDGGFARWQAEGRAGASGAVAPPARVASFGAPFPGRPDYLIDSAGARALLAREDAVLASIRTWSEHTGVTSGYSYISARGDIPGARWGRAGREGDVNSMSDYQDADGRMLPGAVIEAMWREQGIRRDLRTAFYCGTGWRAALAFYYAWLMGWPDIAVYDGGWFEWSATAEGGSRAGADRAERCSARTTAAIPR
ncbi:sulfurtransferase [Pseudoduganella armeniaca]|uniref:Rhodanese n=1 Tax=Pseudoduganella armeniaca TaxID=2072590 RepID=A0A2R4CD57_9BURK|nr:rhodanese-like domain-containing protein [Pseudoduganella armeniaca]AVR97546.1 rhodanese [Pseudoduganella armeniaca]